ncbi:MAG TPA: hypothetical protein VFF74_04675 [Methylophilaceae bacterium]|nr:hypothetical protein [Methylophilaceae bacterium]
MPFAWLNAGVGQFTRLQHKEPSMIGMSYLNVIERYHEYKDALRE